MIDTIQRQDLEQIASNPGFWRVEGSLVDLGALEPVAFFTQNAQSFSGRWVRREAVVLLALIRALIAPLNPILGTRVLHSILRGVSEDRLDFLGEEYFEYVLKKRLKPRGIEQLQDWMAKHGRVTLVSHALEQVVRPLAKHLGVERLMANRLEFRDGLATGRLIEPIIRPRSVLSNRIHHGRNGALAVEQLARELHPRNHATHVEKLAFPAERRASRNAAPIMLSEPHKRIPRLSVREALKGKHILLIGVTGFIGKVWLTKILSDVPEIGRIYLLIRRQRSNSARRRFEKIVADSPAFDPFHERYGPELGRFLAERIEVLEGDVSQPGLGLAAERRARLAETLDLVVNSAGLTEFNPDLRGALATNVESTAHLLDFLRQSHHAGLLHLSTCYVVGARDGRVSEDLRANYTPLHIPGFDAERERQALHQLIREMEARAESPEVMEELRREAFGKKGAPKHLTDVALENQIRKNRIRWLRDQLKDAGTRRAKELGWPNTYTFTKSLAESLICSRGADLPIAVVRPSIVETSLKQPFRGWNEGINTSAPLSYLLGTFFRQLPTNERKCLDLVPVDLVARGMTLIAAAILQRSNERLYQLATSAINPCDMRRSIELTSLAHRKHFRAQEGLEYWLLSRFETVPVSKERFQLFSAPGQKTVVRALKRLAYPLPFVRSRLARRERGLDRVEKLIELYEPFILHNEHVFEAENVELLSEALPPEEREAFGYDARSIDWWEYWINIHIPALRKWCYPLIEGRPLEARPERAFHLPQSSPAVGLASGSRGDRDETTQATWPSS